MRDLLLFIPLTIFYLAVKSTLLPEIPFPDVTLLVIFYVAISRNTIEGALMGFILGYIEDVFTGGIIGSTSFGLVVVFLGVYLASKRMHFTTQAVKAGSAAVLSIVKGVLVYMVLDFARVSFHTALDIFFQALLTGIFAPAVLAVLARLSGLVTPRTFEE